MVISPGKFITTLSNIAFYSGKVSDKNLFLRKKFNRIRKSLSPYSLMYEDDIFLDEEGIFENNKRFLNFYSYYGIDLAFKKYGVKKILKKKGLDNILYKITKNDYTDTLTVYNEKKDIDHLIAQLMITVNTNVCFSYKNCKSMTIEWLNLQDYRKVFTGEKMRLPGQRFPGLGLGYLAFELIIQLARRLEMRYIINTPAYFHNAYIYSSYFSFRNPKDRALTDKLVSVYENMPLASISWLIYNEIIYNEFTESYFVWKPDIMIMPVYRYKDFNNYFETIKYKSEYEKIFKNTSFFIDREKLYDNKNKFPKAVFENIVKIINN